MAFGQPGGSAWTSKLLPPVSSDHQKRRPSPVNTFMADSTSFLGRQEQFELPLGFRGAAGNSPSAPGQDSLVKQRLNESSPKWSATNPHIDSLSNSGISPRSFGFDTMSSAHQSASTDQLPPLVLPNSSTESQEISSASKTLPKQTNTSSDIRWTMLARKEREVVRLCVEEPSFEMLVIGCGGGPLETNLSSYLVKPYSTKWIDGCTSIEGGSSLGAIARLVEDSPESFEGFDLGIGVDAHERSHSNHDTNASGRSKWRKKRVVGAGRKGGGKAASKVWDMVQCFAVSHAHLDHIQGLVISSGASIAPRPLYGTSRTISNINRIFDGGVWPKLVGWENDGVRTGRAYLYRDVQAPTKTALPLSVFLNFHAFPLSHGLDPSAFISKEAQPASVVPISEVECYDSTAFFVQETKSGQNKEFLFFGDVEPDSISKRPLNRAVWEFAAPKVAHKILSVIFLECSYPTSQATERLWGHLSPPFVLEELKVLASLVRKARIQDGEDEETASHLPLKGVTMVIIHIKDDTLSLPTMSVAKDPGIPSSKNSDKTREASTQPAPRQLAMSPPLPTLPIRRASGGAPLAFPTPISASISASDVWSPNRRASLPWNSGSKTKADGLEKILLGCSQRRKWSVASDAMPEVQTYNSRFNAISSPLPSQREVVEVNKLTNTQDGMPEGEEEDEDEDQDDEDDEGEEEEKDDDEDDDETVHERIQRELIDLESLCQTGISFLCAEQGMRIVF